MVHDASHINACALLDEYQAVMEITLSQYDPFAIQLFDSSAIY